MNSVLIIDKPAGLTSHDVVNRARRILHERSIGHLGTLDPMATGVLPLVTGNLTRLAQFYTASEKTYEGTIRFGFATDTYDADGDPTTEPKQVILRTDEIEALAARFRGVIQQTPPPFSAKKIKGVPAYKLARQQKEVVLQPVQVEIKEFEILEVTADRVRFRAHVTSGTYMRSVAHDMGKELACGAHLESLRRTAVAEFTLADAHTLEELADIANHCHPDRSLSAPGGKDKRSGGTLWSRSKGRGPFNPRSSLRPPAKTAPAIPLRHRRRTHRRPHPQRTHRQPPRPLPRPPGQSLRRPARPDRHRHPRSRHVVPPQASPLQLEMLVWRNARVGRTLLSVHVPGAPILFRALCEKRVGILTLAVENQNPKDQCSWNPPFNAKDGEPFVPWKGWHSTKFNPWVLNSPTRVKIPTPESTPPLAARSSPRYTFPICLGLHKVIRRRRSTSKPSAVR